MSLVGQDTLELNIDDEGAKEERREGLNPNADGKRWSLSEKETQGSGNGSAKEASGDQQGGKKKLDDIYYEIDEHGRMVKYVNGVPEEDIRYGLIKEELNAGRRLKSEYMELLEDSEGMAALKEKTNGTELEDKVNALEKVLNGEEMTIEENRLIQPNLPVGTFFVGG